MHRARALDDERPARRRATLVAPAPPLPGHPRRPARGAVAAARRCTSRG